MKCARPGLWLATSLLSFALGACAGTVMDEGDVNREGEEAGGKAGSATGGGKAGGSAGTSSTAGGAGGSSTATGGSSAAGAGGSAGSPSAGAGGTASSPDAGAGQGGATTPDAGSMGSPDATTSKPEEGAVQTIVVAGYAGRRTISRDRGKTWEPVQVLGGGGDDQFLLRDAAFGAGRVVALG